MFVHIGSLAADALFGFPVHGDPFEQDEALHEASHGNGSVDEEFSFGKLFNCEVIISLKPEREQF